jgi:DNA polymerase III subunit gamma/tau
VSLDTKYRPLTYDTVLGQEGTIKVVREFVKAGQGFQQSYLFGGPWGSGKTTLGRILARALLCENPQDGNPCDQCDSCKSILETGSAEAFVEVDAATNSGKADVAKIVEDIEFGTFSGKRRLYLWDECHELSRSAMDAMLLPLEECVSGSQDKKLVCIFCTTEPEKMRPAILSRCAPAFIIRPVSPETIGKRLSYICAQEGIEAEEAALTLIAEATECHVRDAMKAVEGIAMLGTVTRDNVVSYLHMDANALYLDVLAAIGRDLPAAMETAQNLLEKVSPSTAYSEISDLAILGYRIGSLGVGNPPSYVDRERLVEVAKNHGEFMVEIASRLAKHPSRATASMFLCDLAVLHQLVTGTVATVIRTSTAVEVKQTASDQVTTKGASPSSGSSDQSGENPGRVESEPYLTTTGVYIEPRGQRSASVPGTAGNGLPPLSIDQFAESLDRHLQEHEHEHGRSTGRNNMGGSGANPPR